MLIVEKTYEVLRDALLNELLHTVGEVDGKPSDELVILDIEVPDADFEPGKCINERDGVYIGEDGREEVRLNGYFSFTETRHVYNPRWKNKSEELFTPDGGDDSGEDVWGLEYERTRNRTESMSEFDTEVDIEAYSLSIKLEDMPGIESGAKITLAITVENYQPTASQVFKIKKLLRSPRFGFAEISNKDDLILSYDMILGDIEGIEMYGARIFNTMVQELVRLYFLVEEILGEMDELEGLEDIELELEDFDESELSANLDNFDIEEDELPY